MGFERRVEADIDLDAVEYNIKAVQALNPPSRKTLLVIKADAYGHGAVTFAKEFDKISDFYGVAGVDEAMELRGAGITKPILILGYTDRSHYEELIENEIRPAIFSAEDAEVLSETALKMGKKAIVHIKVDTGMSRIGFSCDSAGVKEAETLKDMAGIEIEGIFSHFAKADEYDKTSAKEQFDNMTWFISELEKKGISFKLKHLDNSAGAMELHSDGFDMMRLGIVIYGLYPSDEMDKSLIIKPAMTFKTKVVHVKTLPAGRGISYGWTYSTDKETRVATVSAGYADGYPRSQSGRGEVLIHGKRVPILGRVCMDQFMVDVTELEDVKVGDEVVLFGTQGEENISVEEVAEPANSFNYELVCNIARRVPRVYYRDGREVSEVNYLRELYV